MAIQNQLIGYQLVLSLVFYSSCTTSTTEHIPLDETQQSLSTGKELYSQNCVACHGETGSLGVGGAKNLTKTTLHARSLRNIISDGKGSMPAFKDILTDKELDSLTAHVLTIKN